jgi:Ca-activated chloride channel homolog
VDLRWPVLAIALPLLILALLGLWSRRPRRRRSGADGGLRMAHVARLRALPRYRRRVRRRYALLTWMTLGSVLAAAGAILLAARPQAVSFERTERQRDVMVCLDASVSMYGPNRRVLEQVRQVVADLDGGRVGLTVFSGAAVTLVPLTTDTDYVTDVLARTQRYFEEADFDGYLLIAGIDLDRDARSSLLGDGIVSCTQRFDDVDTDRARSVIVTSDNDPLGKAVYSVQEGADYAADRDVVVHAVAAPREGDAAAMAEFEDAAVSTGGTFAELGDDGTAEALVERIEVQEARRVVVPPRRVVTDDPRWGASVATSGVGMLLLGWLGQSWAARPRPRRDRA